MVLIAKPTDPPTTVANAVRSRAWQQAVHSSCALLSKSEKSRFGESQPSDIVRDFQAAQHARARASRVQGILEKIQPLVNAIERIGKPLDVLANVSPEILSPIWGTLRATLLIARDYGAYFSKLMDMLEQIGDALPRLQVYEGLFSNHQSLTDALSATYGEIIAFLVKAKNLFSRPSISIFLRVLWKPFEQTFQEALTQFGRHADLVEREAGLAHMVEEAQARLELVKLKTIMEENTAHQASRLQAVKLWLGARQCHEERNEIKILPGTCEWILQRPEVSNWTAGHDPQVLWVYGAPGCGKSFLYGKLLNYLSENAQPFVYFLFCGADRERVTISSLLRSWTFQMAKHFPTAMEYVTATQKNSENREATSTETQALFLSLLDSIPDCFLTVDAVDECVELPELYELLSRIPRRFKILITSRLLPIGLDRSEKFPASLMSLEVTPGLTSGDIKRYISHQLSSYPHQSYSSELSAQVNERLLASGGMFLWVRLMLEHLRDQTCEEEMIQCLHELPESLSDRYDHILAGINKMPKARRLLAHKVFFWMTAVRRPLTVRELCTLFAVKPSLGRSNGFDPSRRTYNPETTILSVCGSLVAARGKDRTLYPIHFTVTEYMRDYIDHSNVLGEMTAFYDVQQLKTADSLVAAVCMRYLSLDIITAPMLESIPQNQVDLDLLLQSGNADLDALAYTSMNWFHHMRSVEDLAPPLLAAAEDILDPSKPTLEIFWRIYWCRIHSGNPLKIIDGHKSLSPLHVAAYFGLDVLIPHLLTTQDPAARDTCNGSALWWAAVKGSVPAIRLLIEAGLDPQHEDSYSITPLVCGAANSLEVFIEVAAGISDGKTSMKGQADEGRRLSPLHVAAGRGKSDVVDFILQETSGGRPYGTRLSREPVHGFTPLHLAAKRGRAGLIHSLSCSDCGMNLVDERDDQGRTPLHLAVSSAKCNLETVRELLECGAHPVALDGEGMTPAERAGARGHTAIVAELEKSSTGMAAWGLREEGRGQPVKEIDMSQHSSLLKLWM